MCQTAVINRSLVGLSKRSFARRIGSMSSPVAREKVALARLNGSLDNLYELLYDSYPTVSEEDYNSFGPYLQILIETLKDLHDSYTKSTRAAALAQGIDTLDSNISALAEMDSDIRNFRINIHCNARFSSLMKVFPKTSAEAELVQTMPSKEKLRLKTNQLKSA